MVILLETLIIYFAKLIQICLRVPKKNQGEFKSEVSQ
ncbi:Uncharacterised protein [Wolbachia endosymbiont wPip_Mol of Culex molestus]|nr:Uncharacterised protein [Wolbachia endosymbiont wPip_Mol of Culex molestus]